MELHFSKYHATGNDFIMVDNRDLFFPSHDVSLVSALCDRHFGIGADGLILIQNHEHFDFEMVYFNSDGNPSSFCGNGSRAAVHFGRVLGLISEKTSFLASDGPHHASISGEEVSVRMADVAKIDQLSFGFYLNTGSPHLVISTQEVNAVDVNETGRHFRNDPVFQPGGTNVNFVDFSTEHIQMRTYERGVEGETLSCGTGVTAAALVASKLGLQSPIALNTPGGLLQVFFQLNGEGFSEIILKGPAKEVFKGRIEV